MTKNLQTPHRNNLRRRLSTFTVGEDLAHYSREATVEEVRAAACRYGAGQETLRSLEAQLTFNPLVPPPWLPFCQSGLTSPNSTTHRDKDRSQWGHSQSKYNRALYPFFRPQERCARVSMCVHVHVCVPVYMHAGRQGGMFVVKESVYYGQTFVRCSGRPRLTGKDPPHTLPLLKKSA